MNIKQDIASELQRLAPSGGELEVRTPAGRIVGNLDAVDPIGCRSIIATAQLAKQKKLAVVAGTQRRHQPSYIETMKRIHGGDIGELVGGQCYWNGENIWFREKTGWLANVSDFEWQAGTRYTVDTLTALKRRYPDHRFIWLMGADTVAQFHQWRSWRALAGMVPIAVIHRPGYDGAARAAPAMGWLRWFVRPLNQAKRWTEWSAPAIFFLRLPPDPTSATRLRALEPNWHRRFTAKRPALFS